MNPFIYNRMGKYLNEVIHKRDHAGSRVWHQSKASGSFVKRPPRKVTRAKALAEARVTLPPRRQETDNGANNTYTALAILLSRISVIYSFQRCEYCSHPGWAHPGHCQRSECDCGMNLPKRERNLYGQGRAELVR